MPCPELSGYALQPILAVRHTHGVAFPAEVGFRQILVTGPPGVGKSTLVARIGGWSEEGYLDLTQKKMVDQSGAYPASAGDPPGLSFHWLRQGPGGVRSRVVSRFSAPAAGV